MTRARIEDPAKWGLECRDRAVAVLRAKDWHEAYEWAKSWIMRGGGAWIAESWLVYAASGVLHGQPRTAVHSIDLALLLSLEPLSSLSKLRRLILEDCGKVPSLRPISQLPALRVLYFYGDTNVLDGELDFLRTLPLEDVAFKNRRHYPVRREELASWHP